MVAELSSELIAQLQQAATLLQTSARICILTGAGVSAESGIPTFRDKQSGLWAHYNAEDLATIDAFTRNPQLVWSWYQWRRQLVHDKTPNAAHHAIAEWQKTAAINHQHITLITQNVDDLHEQAGSVTTHLHGHLWRNRCSHCDAPYHYTEGIIEGANAHKAAINFDDALIKCMHCESNIRPDIVWFGEGLPSDEWQIAQSAAAQCEVFMSIGTSSLVYPAAGLAQIAQQNGAKIIEVNPNPTPNTLVDVTLAAKAGIVIPLLVAELHKSL